MVDPRRARCLCPRSLDVDTPFMKVGRGFRSTYNAGPACSRPVVFLEMVLGNRLPAALLTGFHHHLLPFPLRTSLSNQRGRRLSTPTRKIAPAYVLETSCQQKRLATAANSFLSPLPNPGSPPDSNGGEALARVGALTSYASCGESPQSTNGIRSVHVGNTIPKTESPRNSKAHFMKSLASSAGSCRLVRAHHERCVTARFAANRRMFYIQD